MQHFKIKKEKFSLSFILSLSTTHTLSLSLSQFLILSLVMPGKSHEFKSDENKRSIIFFVSPASWRVKKLRWREKGERERERERESEHSISRSVHIGSDFHDTPLLLQWRCNLQSLIQQTLFLSILILSLLRLLMVHVPSFISSVSLSFSSLGPLSSSSFLSFFFLLIQFSLQKVFSFCSWVCFFSALLFWSLSFKIIADSSSLTSCVNTINSHSEIVQLNNKKIR